jgi:hypothetical protein
MTESKELRVPYGEMTTVSLECEKCTAETLINLADPRQQRAWEENRALTCGVCGGGFDSNLKGAVISLANAFRSAKESQQKLNFRIRVN